MVFPIPLRLELSGDAHDQSRKSRKTFRHEKSRGRGHLLVGTRGNPRLPRAEWRGQIHHHADDHRVHPAHGGTRHGGRLRHVGESHPRQEAPRLPAGKRAVLQRHDGVWLPRLLRRTARSEWRLAQEIRASRHRDVLPRAGHAPEHGHAFQRLSPSHLSRAIHPARPGHPRAR